VDLGIVSRENAKIPKTGTKGKTISDYIEDDKNIRSKFK